MERKNPVVVPVAAGFSSPLGLPNEQRTIPVCNVKLLAKRSKGPAILLSILIVQRSVVESPTNSHPVP